MAQDPILTALDARIAALQDVRARVVEALGLGGPRVPGDTIPPARETTAVRRASTPARRASNAPKGETARPTDALSEAAIRTALKQGHTKVDAIITATELPPGKVRRLLAQMVESRAIRVEGLSRATRYHLA